MTDDEREMLLEMPTVQELLRESIREAVAAEREACAQLAWDMQSTQFGGGTAIGNAIADRGRAIDT